ncbi:MAG TPA: alpha-L-arabinofuranosidase [Bryobacteraceae bacterium]|jgi:alpha-L-arabinofuranosidase
MINRRDVLRSATLAAMQSAAAAQSSSALIVDPQPKFDISPWLYMQFMEPLGVADSSVEASWDYDRDDWRKDFVDTTKDLAPGAMRFGGLFSRAYKWREGVGPAVKRPLVRNYFWGGKDDNRVGTHEFVDFSRRVGAEPFYCVNFASDGEKRFLSTPEGNRTADAREAADWVSYANDPDNKERKQNGAAEPLNLKLWQLGNETSYGNRTFTMDQAIAATIEFAKAMRQRDPSLKLIGWGDHGQGGTLWAGELLKRAGDRIDMVAMHMMGQSPRNPDTVLKGLRYEKEPERAWQELIQMTARLETRLTEMEQVVSAYSPKIGIAITEGHLSLSPHNANPILFEWLSAVYHAKSLNLYQRHGARVKIATAADFNGTRWTNVSVMLETPRGISYLLPVASIARLFRKYNGTQGVEVKSAPSSLDIAASRTHDKVYLHVANLEYGRSVESTFTVVGTAVKGGRVYQIAPQNLREYVNTDQPKVFEPREVALGSGLKHSFPPGAVAAVELDL